MKALDLDSYNNLNYKKAETPLPGDHLTIPNPWFLLKTEEKQLKLFLKSMNQLKLTGL